jgi:5-methyltetrahydropteroyltriglutamate--homocysteine methyltransferase
MSVRVEAYQHGIYPRSEAVVAATRGLERGRTTPEEVARAVAEDERDFLEVQREAGLDYASDGLLRWQDVFRPLVEATEGLDARTLVRWFDNNTFFRSPEVSGSLRTLEGLPAVLDSDDVLPHPRVATLPSPYLFSRAAQASGERNPLMMDLTREVLRPVIRGLVERGYELIHLQEPWLVYFGMDGEGWDDVEKAFAELRDAAGETPLVLHTSFGDAAPLIDRLRALPVDAVGIDFVQTDLDELGSDWETGCVVGCLDGRSSPVESVEGTVAFVQRVAATLSPARLFLSSNCELEYLPVPVAREKVRRLGEVSARAKALLG